MKTHKHSAKEYNASRFSANARSQRRVAQERVTFYPFYIGGSCSFRIDNRLSQFGHPCFSKSENNRTSTCPWPRRFPFTSYHRTRTTPRKSAPFPFRFPCRFSATLNGTPTRKGPTRKRVRSFSPFYFILFFFHAEFFSTSRSRFRCICPSKDPSLSHFTNWKCHWDASCVFCLKYSRNIPFFVTFCCTIAWFNVKHPCFGIGFPFFFF